MSILGRNLMKSTRQMMRTYFVAKAAGADHTRAMQNIVHTWYRDSPARAYEFWIRYWRIQADIIRSTYAPPKEKRRLFHRIRQVQRR